MPVSRPLVMAWASARKKSEVKAPARSDASLVVPAWHRKDEWRRRRFDRHHDRGLALEVLHRRRLDVDVLALGVELDRTADDDVLVDLDLAQSVHQRFGLDRLGV